MTSPKYAVITPVRDEAPYVERTIASAQLDRTCKAAVAPPSPRTLTVAKASNRRGLLPRAPLSWRTGPMESMVIVDARRTA